MLTPVEGTTVGSRQPLIGRSYTCFIDIIYRIFIAGLVLAAFSSYIAFKPHNSWRKLSASPKQIKELKQLPRIPQQADKWQSEDLKPGLVDLPSVFFNHYMAACPWGLTQNLPQRGSSKLHKERLPPDHPKPLQTDSVFWKNTIAQK